jgi:hypothetical protein
MAMRKRVKRDPCPVCGQPVARNWRTREMDKHRRNFPAVQKCLVDRLSKFDLNELGLRKYEKDAEELMRDVATLNRVLTQVQSQHV